MADDCEIPSQIESRVEEIREEVALQFHWYMIAFFIIYISSFMAPGIIIMGYLYFIMIPHFLSVNNIFILFTDIKPLIIGLTLPLFLLGCYLLHLLLIAIVTRWLWALTEKKCPSKEGIIPRNLPSKVLNYYHIRGFMIKYGKNAFVKGIFPWLANWFFNVVKSNSIGKETTMEEQVTGDKFVEIGENCYIGPDANLASHLVEGIFGRVSYFKVRVGNNCTLSGAGGLTPGCEIGDNSYFLPLTAAFKHSSFKGNNYYFGIPPRKFFKKNVMEYLGLSKEDFQKEKDLRNKQNSTKNKIKGEEHGRSGS